MQSMTSGATYDPRNLLGRDANTGFSRKIPGHVASLARMQMKQEKPEPPQSGISSSTARLIVMFSLCMMLFAGGLYLAASIFGDDLSRAGHSTSTKPLEIVIGNDVLNVPANTIRFFSQRHSGMQKRLEMYLHWPSLSGYDDALKSEFNGLGKASSLIFLTLEPRTMSYDMSGRIAPIYKRFFTGKAENAGNGLLRQPLSAEGGFIDEDLYYEAASPYPFAARCVRESSAFSTPFCIRDIHLGNRLMLTYRFHKQFLPDWIKLDQSVRKKVKQMLVNS